VMPRKRTACWNLDRRSATSSLTTERPERIQHPRWSA
jgi:hypothetical protein